ncbi:MAG: LLM class flavin-dependent oxidoreductase [Nitrososphaerota archaeon]|nr:LLM class flavin-dependent oxidoreductase [Nitrososphaerota archaeon]
MKFGVRLLGNYLGNSPDLVGLAVHAERNGFDSCWFAHDPFMRSSWALIPAVAARTERIVLGTNFKPYSVDPSEIVMYAVTLDELTSGRVVLGVGSHGKRGFDSLGLADNFDLLNTTRECVEIIRRTLRGGVGYDGNIFRWGSDCYLRFKPLREKIPIYISGGNEEMFRLSGEIGDGTLPMATPPESAEYPLKFVAEGAKKAGRNIDDISRVACVWLSVSKDGKAAEDALRYVIAYFSPGMKFRPWALQKIGLTPADFAPIEELVMKRDYEGAKKLVSDNMMKLAIVGTPNDCIEQIERLERNGITQVSIGAPLGPDPKEAIGLIGSQIIPHFRSDK